MIFDTLDRVFMLIYLQLFKVVTVNYRLGIMGFLNQFDAENNRQLGGNYGLIDQQTAIEFIYENAENLGGDKNRLTIFGESAGGISVGCQLLNEKTVSMISGAISESGPFFVNTNPVQIGPLVKNVIVELCGNITDCNPTAMTAYEALKLCDGEEIMKTYKRMQEQDPLMYNYFGPISFDGVFYTKDADIQMEEGEIIYQGPYIIGTNSFEARDIRTEIIIIYNLYYTGIRTVG